MPTLANFNRLPPTSESELMARVQTIAGMTLGQLAAELDIKPPENLQKEKGWQGQLLEIALGTTASTLPAPDFVELGIELKSLPINHKGQPLESTYVCTVPLTETHELDWSQSWLRQKLAKVLWIPLEADPATPVANRLIGPGLLWSPTPEEDQLLREDWEELMELICLGRLGEITARHGQVLQIRPKAANARVLTETTDAEGRAGQTLPRGFYLRSTFTRRILEQHFILPG